ncbi:MAG: S-layer homology domain-containing protein [bacterium]
MWRLLLLAALLSMVALTTTFAAPFPDVPENHWASSAVQTLKAKGVLEGYPDGLYRGKRAASRYEMAMALSRVVAKLEQLESSLPDFSQFVTKDDLAAVKRMVDENRQYIEELNVRVDALEKKVGELDKRLSKLEKITIHGWYDMAYVNQNVKADQINDIVVGNTTTFGWPASTRIFTFESTMPYSTALVGWNNGDIKPWSNYLFTRSWNNLPISTAEGSLDTGYIKLHGHLSEDWMMDALLSGNNLLFMGLGGQNYPVSGVNGRALFTGESSWIGPTTGTQQLVSMNDNNLIRFETIKLWNKEKSLMVTLGGFNPNITDNSVFVGVPNPWLWDSKPHFAAYGFNVYHKPSKSLFGAELEHELYTGKVSQFSGNSVGAAAAAYDLTQRVFGYAINFKFQKGYFKLMYNVIEDSQEEFNPLGQIMGINTGSFLGAGWSWVSGDVPRLTDPMFAGKYGGAAGVLTQVGPQYQSTIGASFRYNINDRFAFDGKFASSRYLPVKELGLSTSGSMFAAKIYGSWGNTTLKEYEENGKLNAKSGLFGVEYISVDPDYSPFIGITNFFAVPNPFFGAAADLYLGQLPYPVYQPVFNSDQLTYTAHDAKAYPNNRQGVRLNVQYKFSDAFLGWAMYEGLTQKDTTMDMDPARAGTQVKWGYYEPIFGTFGAAAATDVYKKGDINTFNIGFNYKFQSGKYDFTGQYYNTDVQRKIPSTATNAVDNIDYNIKAFDVLFRYFANEKWTWHVAFTSVTSDGKYFQQQDTANFSGKNIAYKSDALRVGFDWKVSDNVNFFANYRFLNFDGKNFDNNNGVLNIDNPDWKGNQLWLGARVKFGQK